MNEKKIRNCSSHQITAMLLVPILLQQLSDNVTVAYACNNSARGSLNFCECRMQGGGATLGQTRPSAHLP